MKDKDIAEKVLALADVHVNGDRPWDIQVNNPKFYSRVLAGGSLALGESYMDGWWDCKNLDQFFTKILSINLHKKIRSMKWDVLWGTLRAKIMNLQSKSRAHEIGKKHYDIGNDLFQHMLDKRMVYSCGYWKNAKTLDKAQEAKLELICKKMGLKPGMTVLDIGCGWGSFVKYAAEKYKVKTVGITVSKEQVKFGRELCKGLPVEIRLQDYRKVNEKFDRIISVGMFEHVGPKNYKTYMNVVYNCLKPDGLFLLHTIGINVDTGTDPWIGKYIFPSGVLPSPKQIINSSQGSLVLEDWHSFGYDYDKTLMAWDKNFDNSWDKIKHNYDERFYRMWKYYLYCCAGTFRSRTFQLWQVVFSKKGTSIEYQSIR